MMLNIVSIIIGAVALLLAIPAFIPLFGWVNWLIVPLAMVGLVVGVLSRKTAGRNLNIVVIIICVVRLMLGGGFF